MTELSQGTFPSDLAGILTTYSITSTGSAIDSTAPVISINGKSQIEISTGESYQDAGATAIDDQDGTLGVTTTGTVDTTTAGTYTLTYTATDKTGNSASATRTITVNNTNTTPAGDIVITNSKLQECLQEQFGHVPTQTELQTIISFKCTNKGLVDNDITELSTAQRQIAWAEVAKRLAHEIKNPLTPIQLSAERLRKKYLTTLGKEDAEVLDKTTTTIMQQVESLKKMVNAFSQYARSPELNKELLDLNKIVKETLDLYQAYEFINFKMDKNMSLLLLDKDSIQRMLINLVKNALEVIEKQENPHIEVETKVNQTTVFLTLIDNGGGLDKAIKDNIFEPYVSSKKKGTGLGLAIVKRIVEKHNGKIKIQNVEYEYGMGAKITIQFNLKVSSKK
jgi:nitrogen fixation/metabolism regulation signal transduction histidine kinase